MGNLFFEFSLLFELKYVPISKIKNMDQLSDEELRSIPTVKESFLDAKKQLVFYSKGLMKKFGDQLKLKQYAVVSIGFDRLFFEEIIE
jgi:hypothetical protein